MGAVLQHRGKTQNTKLRTGDGRLIEATIDLRTVRELGCNGGADKTYMHTRPRNQTKNHPELGSISTGRQAS